MKSTTATSRSPLYLFLLWSLPWLVGIAGVYVWATALPAFGQTPAFDPDAEARRIFTQVMSPYCPGLLLADCTSSAAAVLRDSIKAQLARGRLPEDIVDELVAGFGEGILAAPPYRGLGRLAWLGPIAALLASLIIVFWRVRQRRVLLPVAEPAKVDAANLDPALQERLKEELQNFD